MNNQQRAALSVRDAERDAEILRHQRAMVDIDERYNNKVDDLGQSDKSRVALSMRRNNGSNPQQQPSTNDPAHGDSSEEAPLSQHARRKRTRAAQASDLHPGSDGYGGRPSPSTTSQDRPLKRAKAEKTINFRELFDENTGCLGKEKHKIVEDPEESGMWYILHCQGKQKKCRRGMTFGVNALQGAVRHLGSKSHTFMPSQSWTYQDAIKEIGICVIDCNKELAERNNAAFAKEVDSGEHLPSSRKWHRRRREAKAMSKRTEYRGPLLDLSVEHRQGQPGVLQNSDIVTHPLPGELYQGCWKTAETQRWWAVTVLPFGSFSEVGIDRCSFDETDLAKEIPPCYVSDGNGHVTRWHPDFEHDGPSVRKRKFPVLFFQGLTVTPAGQPFVLGEKNTLCWLGAMRLRQFDYVQPGFSQPRQLSGREAGGLFKARLEAIRQAEADGEYDDSSGSDNSDSDEPGHETSTDRPEARGGIFRAKTVNFSSLRIGPGYNRGAKDTPHEGESPAGVSREATTTNQTLSETIAPEANVSEDMVMSGLEVRLDQRNVPPAHSSMTSANLSRDVSFGDLRGEEQGPEIIEISDGSSGSGNDRFEDENMKAGNGYTRASSGHAGGRKDHQQARPSSQIIRPANHSHSPSDLGEAEHRGGLNRSPSEAPTLSHNDPQPWQTSDASEATMTPSYSPAVKEDLSAQDKLKAARHKAMNDPAYAHPLPARQQSLAMIGSQGAAGPMTSFPLSSSHLIPKQSSFSAGSFEVTNQAQGSLSAGYGLPNSGSHPPQQNDQRQRGAQKGPLFANFSPQVWNQHPLASLDEATGNWGNLHRPLSSGPPVSADVSQRQSPEFPLACDKCPGQFLSNFPALAHHEYNNIHRPVTIVAPSNRSQQK